MDGWMDGWMDSTNSIPEAIDEADPMVVRGNCVYTCLCGIFARTDLYTHINLYARMPDSITKILMNILKKMTYIPADAYCLQTSLAKRRKDSAL